MNRSMEYWLHADVTRLPSMVEIYIMPLLASRGIMRKLVSPVCISV
jgi:hypothetical protein